jgi:hypothetical protein
VIDSEFRIIAIRDGWDFGDEQIRDGRKCNWKFVFCYAMEVTENSQ